MRGSFKITNLFLNCPTILCIMLQKIVPGKEGKFYKGLLLILRQKQEKKKLKTYYNIRALRN